MKKTNIIENKNNLGKEVNNMEKVENVRNSQVKNVKAKENEKMTKTMKEIIKKVENTIMMVKDGRPYISKEDFEMFGKYAAIKASLEEEDSNLRFISNFTRDIDINDIIATTVLKGFEKGLRKKTYLNLRQIFGDLVHYLSVSPESCDLYLEHILYDYLTNITDSYNGDIGIRAYVLDILSTTIEEMVQNIAADCFDNDFIDSLTAEELDTYKLLNNLIDYSIGSLYITYLIEDYNVTQIFLEKLKEELN